jgi:hypothetical protein
MTRFTEKAAAVITKVPPHREAEVLMKAAQQPCEHDDCPENAVEKDYCEKHFEHYYCECGTALEDYAGTPGDGFCWKCR